VAAGVAELKQRTYALMRIELGHRVLDVGCGPGTDTIPLARLVGERGQVVGIDHDEAMIAEADQRAEIAGMGAWVEQMCPFPITDYRDIRYGALLDEVERDALAAGVVTGDELESWRMSLEQADAEGVFFCSVSQVLVAGQKP
jgi:SAM-dependent methyltransferase